MKVLVLYRVKSDHARGVEDFVRNLQHRDPRTAVSLQDVDTREGIDLAKLYDIVEYPAVLVTQDNGAVHQVWVGRQLPLADEVLAYARV